MSRYDEVPLSDDIRPEAVEDEMERILASEKFTRSNKLRTFLRFTVTQTLRGNAATLKEYVIGTEVLAKPASYDPRSDSLVRVLASRLRARLRQYYSNGGSCDPLVIDLPKGGYVPIFQRRERFQAEAEKKISARNMGSRGRFRAAKLTKEALSESVRDLRESIAGDPTWPLAQENLAHAYILQAILGFERPGAVWPLAKTAVEGALELDDLSSDTHTLLGVVQAFQEWNWRDAELHFDKAIARDSYSAAAPLWRALALFIPSDRRSEAHEELRRSQELTPALFLKEGHALGLYLLNEHEAVLDSTSRGSQDEPSYPWLSWVRSMSLAALGRHAAAISLLERLTEQAPEDVRAASTLAFVHAIGGDRSKALHIQTILEEQKEQGTWIANYDLALIQAGLGNQEEALSLLNESLRQKEPWALYSAVDSRLASLKSNPQFKNLNRKMFGDKIEAVR